MRKILLLFGGLMLSACILAQVPQKISYQAVVRDGSDNLIVNSVIRVQISILQGSISGTSIYSEVQAPITNSNGIFSIEVGTGITSDDFSDIDWATGPYYIKTEIDPEGGINYTLTHTTQILAVPYALFAETAGGFSGELAEEDPIYVSSPASTITNANIDNWNSLNDFSGDYDDLMNKPDFSGWDTDLSDDFDGNYSSLNGAPTNISSFLNDANYLVEEVDGSVVNEIQNLNEVLTQGNSANSQIKNLVDPTEAQDAATKAYVDELSMRVSVIEDEIKKYGTMIDSEGNVYKTVRIGEQVWMAENLRLSGGNYPNQDSSTIFHYGLLYQNHGTECPSGWHIPTDNDWKILERYIGMDTLVLDSLGERGTTEAQELKITGSTGFNLSFPGTTSLNYYPPLPYGFGYSVYYVSQDEYDCHPMDPDPCYTYRSFNINSDKIMRGVFYYGTHALPPSTSVRCIKD